MFRFTDIADFYVFSKRIHCVYLNDACPELIEISFKGVVLSFWLEKKGIPVLHASSVVVANQAIAITGESGSGKSSLTAMFLKYGFPMLSDDVLSLKITHKDILGLPGSNFIKLWPNQLVYLFDGIAGSPISGTSKRRVTVGDGGIGAFCRKRKSLSCIYVIDRIKDSSDNSTIRQIPPVEASIELVNQSFLKRILAACNMHCKRLSILTDIAMRIPVKRVTIGEGWECVRDVMQLILEDVDRVTPITIRKRQVK